MSSALPEFESHGGRLEAFDDGHCPETFRFPQAPGNNDDAPRIVMYDRSPSSAVHIYDQILNPNVANMLYEVTASGRRATNESSMKEASMNLQGESPWGTYVTIKEALEWIEFNKLEGQPEYNSNNFEEYLVAWRTRTIQFYNWQNRARRSEEKKEPDTDNEKCIDLHKQLDDMDNVRHALAVEAVAKLFIETVPNKPGTTAVATAHCQSSDETLLQSAEFLKQVHGVAVWALSSGAGQSVHYHVDYAELLRYEYNVTVPPLWAGTIQCSALWDDKSTSTANCTDQNNRMSGGEFCVNLRGLDHYAEHGYKGNLSGDPTGGWRMTPYDAVTGQHFEGGVHMNNDDQWVTIPYAFNRGIVHRGDLPHLSAPIKSIGTNDKSRLSRVIVGFNVFGHDVGANIAKAPEHSKPFRRKVRLYRSTININNASMRTEQSVGGKMDLSQIRKNKGLTKLLVLAKREKVKEELRRNQEQLSHSIWNRLLGHHNQNLPLLRVADIVEEFGSSNDGLEGRIWPKSIDVHVHLHHMLLSTNRAQDMTQQQRSPMNNCFQDTDGIAGPVGMWYCITVADSSATLSDSNTTNDSNDGLMPLSTKLDIVEANNVDCFECDN